LTKTTSEQIAVQMDEPTPPQGVGGSIWEQWQKRFKDYLDHYGYSVYDMDYAKPLPMDEPAPLFETLKLFITGHGKNPYERQETYSDRREQAVEATRARLRGVKRWAFEKTLGIAQARVPLREDGITELGLGYPVLRDMLRELGRRFVTTGTIQEVNDIFWLEQTEVESMVARLESEQELTDLKATVKERKLLWQARKLVAPPPQLPPGKKVLGVMDVEGILAGGEGGLEGNVISGVPTSPGKVTATARVLHGPQDFDQMQPGDILVAGITTPAWTPLFTMASGVVTDIGGPLSHGSIVAREYGIPAVMGTGIGTKLIKSGQTITLDGTAGTIQLHEDE
jgi:pyruvate,water dikinase